jgi:hypothetical protein
VTSDEETAKMEQLKKEINDLSVMINKIEAGGIIVEKPNDEVARLKAVMSRLFDQYWAIKYKNEEK